MLNYEEVARQAARWALDPNLSNHARNVAGDLADLTRILIDPRYGCRAEHDAAEVMYKHLRCSLERGDSLH